MQTSTNQSLTRAIVAAVHLQNVSDVEFEASLTELRELAKTLGYTVVGTFIQKRAKFDSAAYLGIGKRQEMRRFVEHGVMAEDDFHAALDAEAPDDGDAADVEAGLKEGRAARGVAGKAKAAAQSAVDEETRHADVVLVDHDISPSQARNLEIEVGAEVMDRTMVILEIFHRHATSRAARAQVEIARLRYMSPRLREAAKLAGPQGRQRSGTGGRGAGESQLALDRQKIRNRIAELEEEIVAMDLERRTQRARRAGNASQAGTGLARVALVGYTNAGKSTLMRALTGSDVLVANKLFATLDTTVRALHPETVPRVLVSDTVGFIKNLPHDLVASFKSTLEEAAESGLLLHVIDASDPGFERQLAVTDKVLAEVGAGDVPRLRVFNKIDMVGAGLPSANATQAGRDAAEAERRAELAEKYPGCIVMSAKRDVDVAMLHAAIQRFFQKDMLEAELFLPWSEQPLRGKIFGSCEVLEERSDNDGTFLRVRGSAETVEGFRGQLGEKIPG